MGKKSKVKKIEHGRPPKVTEEQVRILADALAIWQTDENACARAGIDYEYFDNNWRKLEYLYGAIKKAKADREYSRLESIDQGLPGWQAMAWLLERTNPRFRLNSQDIEITKTNTASSNVDTKAIKQSIKVGKTHLTFINIFA